MSGTSIGSLSSAAASINHGGKAIMIGYNSSIHKSVTETTSDRWIAEAAINPYWLAIYNKSSTYYDIDRFESAIIKNIMYPISLYDVKTHIPKINAMLISIPDLDRYSALNFLAPWYGNNENHDINTYCKRLRPYNFTHRLMYDTRIYHELRERYARFMSNTPMNKIDQYLFEPLSVISNRFTIASIALKLSRGEIDETNDMTVEWGMYSSIVKGLLSLTRHAAWIVAGVFMIFDSEPLY